MVNLGAAWKILSGMYFGRQPPRVGRLMYPIFLLPFILNGCVLPAPGQRRSGRTRSLADLTTFVTIPRQPLQGVQRWDSWLAPMFCCLMAINPTTAFISVSTERSARWIVSKPFGLRIQRPPFWIVEAKAFCPRVLSTPMSIPPTATNIQMQS